MLVTFEKVSILQIYGATKIAFNLPHETTKKGTKDKQWFSRHLTLSNKRQ